MLVFRNKKIGVEWFKCSVRRWRMITWANKLYTVLVSKLELDDRVYLGLLHVLEADLKCLVMGKLRSKRKTIPTSFYRQHARYLLGKSRMGLFHTPCSIIVIIPVSCLNQFCPSSIKRMQTCRHFDVFQGVPGDGKFDTAKQLSQTLSSILFASTVGHAAANVPQYDEYAYLPNYPAILTGFPPREKVRWWDTYARIRDTFDSFWLRVKKIDKDVRTSRKLLLDWVKAWIFTRNVRIDDEVWVWLTTGRELKLATWRCAEEPGHYCNFTIYGHFWFTYRHQLTLSCKRSLS